MKPMYSFRVHLLIAAKAITIAEIPQISKFQSFLRQFLSSGFGMLWTFQSHWVLWYGRPSRLVSPWASPRVRQSERELRASGLCWHPTESLGILKLEYITYIQHHTESYHIYIYINMYHFARLESKRLWVRLHMFMHLHSYPCIAVQKDQSVGSKPLSCVGRQRLAPCGSHCDPLQCSSAVMNVVYRFRCKWKF